MPRVLRWSLRLGGWLLAIALAIVLGFTLYAVTALPSLQPWHTKLLREEFRADRHANLDYAGYLQLEARLFDELKAITTGWARDGLDPACVASASCAPGQDEAFLHSRFNPASRLQQLADGAPYNRSFRLGAAQPLGRALLVHGLTDAPYSMKALAEVLRRQGFEVTVLRLPGHGTLPSMMTEMSTQDWTAALRLAARDVAARTPSSQPFYVGGYSTGGTLVLQYALDALNDVSLRRPDRVLLMSPAIELTPVARLAELIDVLSIVPLPVLDKVRWQEIAPEFDPYKFNSFPVNASRQVNRATLSLQRALTRAERDGQLAQLAPVVTWQSVVDATVGSRGVADVLYARLSAPAHRLVLFDMNRDAGFSGVARPSARTLIDRLSTGRRGYTLDIVSNREREDERVAVQRLAPDDSATLSDTQFAWPASLVSLSHVALPFPPGDPVYGFLPGSGRDGVPSIGSWLLRGENGAITLSLGSLTRLRSNPFWALIEQDVASLVAQDLSLARR